MKKLTSILLFTVLMYSALSQQDIHKLALKGFGQNQFLLNQPIMSSSPTIKLDSVIITRNYSINTVWTSPVKKIYEYDSNYRLSQITEKTWNKSKRVFDITGKTQFFYNPQGLLDYIFLIMNYLTHTYSYKYFYDKSGKMESVYHYMYSHSKLEQNDFFDFTYNELGKPDVIKVFSGDYMQLGYVLNFTYNHDGNLIEFKRSIGNYTDDITHFEYDKDGNLVSEQYEGFVFGDRTKTEHFYNATGDRIKSNFYSLSNSGWLMGNTQECNYCDLNCAELVQLPIPPETYYYPIEYTSNKLVQQVFQTIGSKIEKSAYYYSPLVMASTEKINNSEISVYPNPATDQITFSWNSNYNRLNLKIFNVTGACVMDREI